MTEKAQELKEDARTYKEKLQAKRRNEEEDWDDLDLDELDADEAAVEKAAVAEEAPAEEAPVAEAAADVTAAAAEEVTSEEDMTEEEVDPVMEKYAKNVETVLDSVQFQMEQIDECEDFLKSAFGDVDPSEWEDDEEEETTEEKKEEEK